MSERELLICPFCGSADCRVIGGPGTKGGPKYWAGCDHCSGRAWGDTEAEAIAAWNRRSPSRPLILEEAAKVAEHWRELMLAAGVNDESVICAAGSTLADNIRALIDKDIT